MGQGVTHMTVINASPAPATVSAHVHGVQQNTHEQHTITIQPQQSGLISLTRQAAGDFHVDWAINFSNGTHAEFRDHLPPMQQSKTMLLGNANVTIDGNNVAHVKRGTARKHPHHAAAKSAYAKPMDVPPAVLPRGRVIRLRSYKTGKNIIVDREGNLTATGGDGPFTRFVVDPSPSGHLRLRSEKFPDKYIALKGQAGSGGGQCELRVQMIGPNRYILRSIDGSRGVGFRQDGCPKPSQEVGLGEGASFTMTFADVQHPPFPGHAPPGRAPPGRAPPPAQPPFAPPPAQSPYPPPPAHQSPFAPPPAQSPYPPPPAGGVHPALRAGAIIRLQNVASGKFVRINADNTMTANGGQGEGTRFTVNPSLNGNLRFESIKHPGRFLSAKGTSGSGGEFTEFVAHPTGQPNTFNFRLRNDAAALGFNADASVKQPSSVGRGKAGTFVVFPA
ncbi:hypothetical protein PTSG_03852 [Salpingoeca rosetta]|uniref:Uncharacterized protein n=1 Tax=Salpingoeca rosetta (strain ATCC 50818 / BSB-021) TaxID=946362 RepID=F2U5K4_SALR5|nr:uncharacterized protein PTSG_03852 [Salpingoeca rosetta]EGD83220.1 hypothetical protein PTSG_03852 [Salpingoeca rosetta]|eukprot:XP_004995584.1 hypothetical protein PTSG_03852 [Salpingoeca rosetta]